MRSGFTVSDIFMQFLGKDYQVIAGEAGMGRPVSWVHSLEAHDLSSFSFHGQEFVFTTGVDLTQKGAALAFLKELIGSNVSGVCLETALYYKEVEQEVIDFANEFGFPLFICKKIIPMKRLIREINARILTNDEDFYKESEQFYRTLLEMEESFSLSDYVQYAASPLEGKWDETGRAAISAYVHYAASYLGIEVAYWHILTEPICSSEKMPDVRLLLSEECLEKIDSLSDNEVYTDQHIAVMRIKVLSERYAYILFYNEEEKINRYQLLILRRFTLFFRSRLINAFMKRIQKEHVIDMGWGSLLLQGRLSSEVLKGYLERLGLTEKPEKYLICCAKLPNESVGNRQTLAGKLPEEEHLSDFVLQTSINVFRSFKSLGFILTTFVEDFYLKAIVFIPPEMTDWQERLKEVAVRLEERADVWEKWSPFVIGIGKAVSDVADIPQSYKSALFCCNMLCHGKTRVICYDQLYTLRIIEYLKESNLLNEFVYDHLGPLLTRENEELLMTLKEYYACNCAKQQTAKNLFIERRTLYLRLKKIEKILGDDFEQGKKRVALELALYGMDYLQQSY